MNQTFSLYIHWPFCRKKCSYCDLNSHVREEVKEEVWIDALISEMNYWAKNTSFTHMESIFFGGGTPSLIQPKNIAKLIQEAKRLWKYSDTINCDQGSKNLKKTESNLLKPNLPKLEITLETNPSSLESESLEEFKKAGINRISFGVQSLDNRILKLLNRTHSAEEALQYISNSLKIFNNVSIDIMYGLPTQTLEILGKTLDKILKTGVHHISIYELTIQKNTLLYNQIANKELSLPSEDEISDEYEKILFECEKHGYQRYEISSFSKKHYESAHNLNYWKSKQFIGIGAGAHARISLNKALLSEIQQSTYNKSDDFTILNKIPHNIAVEKNETEAYCSIENAKMPEKWLQSVQKHQHGVKNIENIPKNVQIQEFIMMGLRMVNGFDLTDLESRFKTKNILPLEKLNELVKHNYLEMNNTHIKLTNTGIIRHGAICKYLIF